MNKTTDTNKKELKSLAEVLAAAQDLTQRSGKHKLAVVQADDVPTLGGVNLAVEKGLVEPVLFGEKKKIRQILKNSSIDADKFTLVDTDNAEQSIFKAAEMAVNGEAALMIQGNIQVPQFFHSLFDENCSFRRRGDFLSLVGVIEHKVYSGLLLLSDIGMIVDPTVDQGIKIIKNAVSVARLLGKEIIRVGLLAFEDTPVAQSPTTIAESVISQFFNEEKDPGVIVEGPIRLDQALKHNAIPCIPTDEIKQGKADILIANNIHAGNSMYKAMITLCGAASAPVVVGGRCPISLPSRSESPENILNSIALAVLIKGNSIAN